MHVQRCTYRLSASDKSQPPPAMMEVMLTASDCVLQNGTYFVFMHERASACMHACIYLYTHACVHACIHACMYVFIYVCMHVYMYGCPYAWMHVWMHVSCVYVLLLCDLMTLNHNRHAHIHTTHICKHALFGEYLQTSSQRIG
jgi:hypothetical protein